jgi:ubiquinone/menaquinone biosynthesis C-methylase UbiE
VKPARFAKAFDLVASEYERGRPSYPPEAVDRMAEALGLSTESTVVDLAAGTGKLTRELAPRFCRVIAVEPLGGMLDELRRSVPEAEAIEGRAEAIPVADGSADAVFAAQAFHWFANEAALAEIARVLRPGGGLGLIWNISPWETREGPWFGALDDLLEASPADLSVTRRHAEGSWRDPVDTDERFVPLTHESFSHEQRLTRDGFIASLESRSYMAMLETPEREAIIEAVQSMFERTDAPLDGDEVVIPQTAHVFWTCLKP